MNNRLISMAVVASAGAACSAQTWNFDISGLQEVAPNASPGVGTGTVTYNAMTSTMSWNISWSGLLAVPTMMHFHQAPAGTNGGVVINITGWTGGTTGGVMGMTTLSPSLETALLAGNLYFNLHTQVFPGGEIRGQVVPAPAAGALLGMGILAAGRRRR